ncbi:similar to Saccharomyces cerevisiae YJL201W ECM25 Non-essential protein of unknown function [Maudiozyma saulgeensis]|uniref:Rho-GAP domain-containing protein n=1 Tax=Maudiozyma saulgeensis TaxID=1789683 RepID=A0A1X7R2D3_9SACH|nr:similar to Saccharomyces cerevisiae YJL201W ECM25 Non-essential protein of unknown function [Kazachstania saulgeensis]
MIDINVNNIFFKSYSIDPNSGHSIYVFDSTYLPDPTEIGGDKQVYDLLIDELMDMLITKLPQSPYSLVVFSSGFTEKKISWVYGIKMFSKLPKESRFFLQKTYIVHESFFIRTVYQVLTNAMNIKFLPMLGKDTSQEEENSPESSVAVVHVPDLTTLSRLIDITRLRISLNVYLHDYEICEYIDVPEEYFTRLTDLAKRKYRQLIFDKIFKKISIYGVKTELLFQKPGTYRKVNIFLDIIERNNYIDISQWDIYSLGSVFLHFVKNKAHPLVPIDMIQLPISDDINYTFRTFVEMINFNNYYHLFITIFPLFISIMKAEEITKHTSRSLSKALAPTLCKEKLSMNNTDRLAIGTRFIKNLLENFDQIVSLCEKLSRRGRSTSSTKPLPMPPVKKVQSIQTTPGSIQSTPMAPPVLPKPRKSSPSKYNTSPSRSSSGFNNEPRSESPIKSFSSLKLSKDEDLSPETTDSINRPKSPMQLSQKSSIPNLSIRISSTDSTLLSSTELTEENLRFNNMGSNYQSRVSSGATVVSGQRSASGSSVMRTPPSIMSLPDTTEPAKNDTNGVEYDAMRDMVTDNVEPLPVSKFEKFDKELKKKQLAKKAEIKTKDQFSQVGFSGMKEGLQASKVSKLAALYEERLQGLKVIDEMMKKK